MDHIERFLLAKVETMSQDNIEAETGEHGEDGEHGDALAAPLPLVEDGIAFQKRCHPSIMLFLSQFSQSVL
jgi:hypothetical protein